MDYVAVIKKAGLRVVSGQRRLQAALSAGLQVTACDGKGRFYRIAIEENALFVQEVPGQQTEGSMIIVAPVEP